MSKASYTEAKEHKYCNWMYYNNVKYPPFSREKHTNFSD